jgi:hypothetical protein
MSLITLKAYVRLRRIHKNIRSRMRVYVLLWDDRCKLIEKLSEHSTVKPGGCMSEMFSNETALFKMYYSR